MPPAPPPTKRCGGCYKEVKDDDVYCTNCGYPLKGTTIAQSAFLSKINKQDFDLIAFKKRADRAGRTLYFLASLFILGALIGFIREKDNPDALPIVLTNIILGALFLLFGDYSKKKPLICFVCGFCLFILMELMFFLQNFNANFNIINIIYVTVILVFLVLGIRSAIDIEKIKKENNIT